MWHWRYLSPSRVEPAPRLPLPPTTFLHITARMPTLRVDPSADEELQDVANALLKARKVVVITGAGISTNSGIPVRLPRLGRALSFFLTVNIL